MAAVIRNWVELGLRVEGHPGQEERAAHRVDGLHDPGCCGDTGSIILPIRMHREWLSVHCLHFDVQLPQCHILAAWDRDMQLGLTLSVGLYCGCSTPCPGLGYPATTPHPLQALPAVLQVAGWGAVVLGGPDSLPLRRR